MSEYHEVEKVLAKRVRRGRVQYKIHWKNFSKAEATWVYEDDCRCAFLIKNYEIERLHYLIGEINVFGFYLSINIFMNFTRFS